MIKNTLALPPFFLIFRVFVLQFFTWKSAQNNPETVRKWEKRRMYHSIFDWKKMIFRSIVYWWKNSCILFPKLRWYIVYFFEKNDSDFSFDFDHKIQNKPVDKKIHQLKSAKKVTTWFYLIISPTFLALFGSKFEKWEKGGYTKIFLTGKKSKN